jgi:two-component system, OmpR family, response regulator
MEATASDPKPGKGKILCADDDPSVLRVMGLLFAGNGYDPILARDGEEALTLFRQHKEELVAAVLDLRMPKMSGLVVAAEIRKETAKLPLIAVSAYLGRGQVESTAAECDKAGFSAHTTKPFSTDPFIQMVDQWVQKYKEGRAAP